MEFNVFSFPFEQIGWGLRQLSLSGSSGNAFAIIIYLLIGLIPAGGFLLLKKKRKSCTIDIMLLVLSVLLYVMMYYMINPGLIVSMVAGAGRMMWGATFYSMLMTYFVIRLLTKNIKTDLNSLQKSLRRVLIFIMFLFAASVAIEMFVNLPAAWDMLAGEDTGTEAPLDLLYGEPDLILTYVGVTLRSIATALPNALSAVVVFFCIKVLKELLRDAYSEQAVVMIKKIGLLCKRSLITVAIMVMVVNVLQLMFAAQIYNIHIVVAIPVFSILFLLVIHVMARYIEENQRLKKDNDLFI